MPDYPRIDPAVFTRLKPRLDDLRDSGLLASLDDARAQRLLAKMYAPRFSRDLLAALVETHLRDAPGNDVVAHQGDWWSAARLETLTGRSFANVLWDDAEHEHVHLVGRGCMRAKAPGAWLAIYEAALDHVGDARRFVSLAIPVQPDERMFLLVTDDQAQRLAKHHLLARSPARRSLPPVVAGREASPASVLALVEALRDRGVAARAAGARIVIDADLAELVARVRQVLPR